MMAGGATLRGHGPQEGSLGAGIPGMPKGPVIITIVGGGVYSPRLCEALARAIEMPELELRLSARNPDRLRILANHGSRRVLSTRPGWSVTAAPSLEAGLEGVSIAILLARVGGFAARAWDEEFPRRFGLVGDEGLGPGGVANAWRTVPELDRVAAVIRRIAPGARIMNLMGPLGITTRLLLERGLEACGVCELPLVTLQTWLARAHVTQAEATWRYGGLNHLGWFWNVEAGGRDLLGFLADRQSPPGEEHPVDRPTVEHFQAAPLRYFYEIFEPEARRRLGLERRPGRAGELAELSETLLERFASAPGTEHSEAHLRPTPWLDRAVAPIASALLGGPPHAGFADLRNGGLIPELPAELVVEVPATFTRDGASPVCPGPLPERVGAFLGHAGGAESLAFAAAERRDPTLLVEAMRALPLPISEATAGELAALAQAGPA
jgi:6-phospho-beta-glucosidase